MPLNPILLEKLNDALLPVALGPMTLRDAQLPAVPGKVHAVIGMRRAGKTTFLRQLQAAARQSLPPQRAVYLSFDDDRLADVDAQQLALLIEEYYRRYPELRGTAKVYWLLDEVQLVPGWDRVVRRLLDTEQVEIVVSGSSARMLSREVHTSLRGRGMETIIRPFGFREFLRHRGEEPQIEPARWTSGTRSLIEKRFGEYLHAGGFPETQGFAPAVRVPLLQSYVDSVLFRDVVERYGISQVTALRWLVRQCLRNPAGEFSIHRLHLDLKAQGHGVAKDAVHAMFAHLIDAFLIDAVTLATGSERRRNSNPRKVYPIDTGLIDAYDIAYDKGGRANLGRALETVVHAELARRGADLGYVRTRQGFEVDFLAHLPGKVPALIQVCADISDVGTLARELRAFDDAAQEYPHATRHLLVLDRSAMATAVPYGVVVQPVYEWLLTPPGTD